MCCVVELISPPDGAALGTSPVELTVRLTSGGIPQGGFTTRFSVDDRATGQETVIDRETDDYGYATVLFPAMPGNYSWHVAVMKSPAQGGYSTIVSSSRRFSVRLLLVVEPLLPSTFILAVSPVDFKAQVTDMNGLPVQSASVAFYVDSIMIGSNLTGQNGIAELSKALTMGSHTWYASASKEGEGGISDTTLFIVGQPTSLVTGDYVYRSLGPAVLGHSGGMAVKFLPSPRNEH
jgi:hypothetical protein